MPNYPRESWKLDDGRIIDLIMPEEFDSLDDGEKLICINGKTYVKGKDYINLDTRGGFIAFGLLSFEDFLRDQLKRQNHDHKPLS